MSERRSAGRVASSRLLPTAAIAVVGMALMASPGASRPYGARVADVGRRGCLPTTALAREPGTLVAALRAARALIPTAYNARLNPWASHPRFLQVMLLEPATPALPGAAHWRNLGARRCGWNLAAASWVIVAEFPRSQVVRPPGVVFLVRARGGWRLWYRYR